MARCNNDTSKLLGPKVKTFVPFLSCSVGWSPSDAKVCVKVDVEVESWGSLTVTLSLTDLPPYGLGVEDVCWFQSITTLYWKHSRFDLA